MAKGASHYFRDGTEHKGAIIKCLMENFIQAKLMARPQSL